MISLAEEIHKLVYSLKCHKLVLFVDFRAFVTVSIAVFWHACKPIYLGTINNRSGDFAFKTGFQLNIHIHSPYQF